MTPARSTPARLPRLCLLALALPGCHWLLAYGGARQDQTPLVDAALDLGKRDQRRPGTDAGQDRGKGDRASQQELAIAQKDAGQDLGRKEDVGGVCGAATCSGCCKSGVCVPLLAQAQGRCGKNGNTCTGCANSQVCDDGVCVATPCTSCFTGCCDTLKNCLSGKQGPCGRNGASCTPCPTYDYCVPVPGGGACASLPGCGLCFGCCTGASCVTVGQQSDLSCGLLGATCAKCPSTTPKCCTGVCMTACP